MLSEALHLIPYALIAALSPLGFAAALAVIESGRLKALAFAVGFVTGQLLACGALVLIGGVTVPHPGDNYPTLQATLALSLGVVLLWLAVRVYHHPTTANRGTDGRSQKVLARLKRVHFLTALAGGLLLGIGGPKRLVLTVLAAASITASGIDGGQQAVLVIFYSALATVLVWASILAFVLFGRRAVAALNEAHEWLGHHTRKVTIYSLAIVGVILVVDGVVALL